MFRGYASGVILREDIAKRVKCLRDSIEKLEKEVAVRGGRIQRLKKELGITYSPKWWVTILTVGDWTLD